MNDIEHAEAVRLAAKALEVQLDKADEAGLVAMIVVKKRELPAKRLVDGVYLLRHHYEIISKIDRPL